MNKRSLMYTVNIDDKIASIYLAPSPTQRPSDLFPDNE